MNESIRNHPKIAPLFVEVKGYHGGKAQECDNLRRALKFLTEMFDEEHAQRKRLIDELDTTLSLTSELQYKIRNQTQEIRDRILAEYRLVQQLAQANAKIELLQCQNKTTKLDELEVEIPRLLRLTKALAITGRSSPYKASSKRIERAAAQLEQLRITAEQSTQDLE